MNTSTPNNTTPQTQALTIRAIDLPLQPRFSTCVPVRFPVRLQVVQPAKARRLDQDISRGRGEGELLLDNARLRRPAKPHEAFVVAMQRPDVVGVLVCPGEVAAEGLHDHVSTFGIFQGWSAGEYQRKHLTLQGISIISLLFRYENPCSLTVRLGWIIYLIGPEEYSLLPRLSFHVLAYFVLIFTLANYANVIGLGSSQASLVPALFMLGQATGRPAIGALSDRFGRINITLLMTFVAGIFSLVVWVNAKTFAVLILFALIVGLTAGVFWVNCAPVLVEVMGMENLSSGLSILWLVIAAPCTFSAPIALQIYAGTGSYLGAQLFCGFMFVASALCMFVLRGWKVARVGNDGGNFISSGGSGERKTRSRQSISWACACFKFEMVQ
ncbi:hypothetical protein LA080_002851 [Diaporthe eres]|nr:hypothetical protein LA080_002851 [Diaporthe eres]